VSAEDEQGFEDFIVREGGALLAAACLLAGGRQEGEDLLQSVLERVVPRWSRIRSGAPGAYVRRALVNAAVDGHRRRRLRLVPLDRKHEVEFVAAPDEGPEERDRLLRALAQIAPRRRAVLVLRYYEDLSEDMIASTLGVSVGTVKSQAARGLSDLRAVLESSDVSEVRG
jgi:RNA polymerase sigma-70 factor (sigma-E family)